MQTQNDTMQYTGVNEKFQNTLRLWNYILLQNSLW